MAKRMRFSVVGLPHYTIWHLYEPSADDLKHMERMEEERKSREKQEAAEKAKAAIIAENFDTNQKENWEAEKAKIAENVLAAGNAPAVVAANGEKLVGGEEGPQAHAEVVPEGQARAAAAGGRQEIV